MYHPLTPGHSWVQSPVSFRREREEREERRRRERDKARDMDRHSDEEWQGKT